MVATTLAPQRTRDCIDASIECAVACTVCADRCQQDRDKGLASCAELCQTCADSCLANVPSLARETDYRGQFQACAELCEACANECEKYDDPSMRACAEACRRTTAAYRALVS